MFRLSPWWASFLAFWSNLLDVAAFRPVNLIVNRTWVVFGDSLVFGGGHPNLEMVGPHGNAVAHVHRSGSHYWVRPMSGVLRKNHRRIRRAERVSDRDELMLHRIAINVSRTRQHLLTLTMCEPSWAFRHPSNRRLKRVVLASDTVGVGSSPTSDIVVPGLAQSRLEIAVDDEGFVCRSLNPACVLSPSDLEHGCCEQPITNARLFVYHLDQDFAAQLETGTIDFVVS